VNRNTSSIIHKRSHTQRQLTFTRRHLLLKWSSKKCHVTTRILWKMTHCTRKNIIKSVAMVTL